MQGGFKMGEIYRLKKNPRPRASRKAKCISGQRLNQQFGERGSEFDIPPYLAAVIKDLSMQQTLRNQLSHPNRSKHTAKKTRLNRRPESRRIGWIEELEARQLRSVSHEVAELSVYGTQASQRAGVAIAASGNNLVVGAYLTDIGGIADAGVVSVYDASSGALLRTITKTAPASSDLFGQALAVHADGAILVGSPLDNLGVTDAGAAFLYDSDGNLKA